MKFDLGGVGKGGERTTVNFIEDCDINHDILNLDGFIPDDNCVEEFFMSHTLEHVPQLNYVKFLKDLYRKLKSGGRIIVIQTDIGKSIRMYSKRQLSFRSLRSLILTPEDRLKENPYHFHHSMWSTEELKKDFERCGFKAHSFDAGYWGFDMSDTFYPEDCAKDTGKRIPNLGVFAVKDSNKVPLEGIPKVDMPSKLSLMRRIKWSTKILLEGQI